MPKTKTKRADTKVKRVNLRVAERDDDLRPIRRRRFVPAEVAIAAFSGVGRIDRERFRADVDRAVDQDPTPIAWDTKRVGG